MTRAILRVAKLACKPVRDGLATLFARTEPLDGSGVLFVAD
jgi:hypothetical protein